MKSYKFLNKEDRAWIESYIKDGYSIQEIAEQLGRTNNTIKQEIERNGGFESYDALQAQRRRDWMQAEKNKTRKKLPENPYSKKAKAKNKTADEVLNDDVRSTVRYYVAETVRLRKELEEMRELAGLKRKIT